MKAIVVLNGQITVDGTVYNALTYKAKLDGSGLIFIYNDPVSPLHDYYSMIYFN